MSGENLGAKKLSERIETIVDEAKSAAADAIHLSGVESIGETLKHAMQRALSARENVVMVRLNKESLSRLEELVDAGLVNSRSEAAAFLISEGAKSRSPLFDQISDKIEQIRKAKKELRELFNEPND